MEELRLNIVIESVSYEELKHEDKTLIDAALKYTRHSYSPYSGFSVGAAVMLDNGHIICGSNQENAAYPSGLCAERVAMFSAKSTYPDARITAIAIAAKDSKGFTPNPVTPCGACRQVMSEYEKQGGTPIRILMYGSEKILIAKDTASLLPLAF